MRNNGKRKRTGDGQAAEVPDNTTKRRREGSAPSAESESTEVEKLDGALAEQQLRSEERRSTDGESSTADEREAVAPRSFGQAQEAQEAKLAEPPLAVGDEDFATWDEGATAVAVVSEVIETQFSLDAILKHRELRLIEQELAKCRVAYEQLRRCHLLPHPASTQGPSMAAESEDMSGLDRSQGPSNAPWAPTSGVTDGPYTRHYARWLIPDPRFGDATERTDAPAQAPVLSHTSIETRATRKAGEATSLASGKGRLRGGPVTSKSKTAGGKKATANQRSGPPIIKRSSDGLAVRLVCIDCKRTDFSTAQGFINHCRISHQRGFGSHDAAANACGQPVELDEHGHVVGEVDDQGNDPKSLVHPLVRSAPTSGEQVRHVVTQQILRDAGARRGKANETSTGAGAGAGAGPGVGPGSEAALSSEQTRSADFTPSSETPHLSAMMLSTGMEVNLASMISEATEKVDLGAASISEDDDYREDDDGDDYGSNGGRFSKRPRVASRRGPVGSSSRTTRQTAVATTDGSFASGRVSKPVSTRSTRRRRPAATALHRSTVTGIAGEKSSRSAYSVVDQDHETAIPGLAAAQTVIPTATATTTSTSHAVAPLQTAPSLVTDDGDDDYEPHSPSATNSSVGGGGGGSDGSGESAVAELMDMDVEVEDASDATQPQRPRPPNMPSVGGDVKPGAAQRGGATVGTLPNGPTTRSRNLSRSNTLTIQDSVAETDHDDDDVFPTPTSTASPWSVQAAVAPPPPPAGADGDDDDDDGDDDDDDDDDDDYQPTQHPEQHQQQRRPSRPTRMASRSTVGRNGGSHRRTLSRR